MSSKEVPSAAQTVIIGAGIVGNSLAYWLSEMGRDDIILIDKGPLPDPGGSTGHASNFMFPVTNSKMITQLSQRSREIYKDMDTWEEPGALEVARTDTRLNEFDRRVQLAKSWGEPAELLSVEEIKEHIPFINEEVIKGGFYAPKGGTADPLRAGEVMRARAKDKDALTEVPNTEVLDLVVQDGEIAAVETDKGTIEANEVVIAAGIWSPKIAEMAGVEIPLSPVVHQMISVGPIDELQEEEGEINHPVVRDVDARMYERPNAGDMEVGSYLHPVMLWDIEDIPSLDVAPLSPTQPPLTEEKFEESMQRALELMPEILDDPDAGIKHGIDGLMSHSPDGAPLLGPLQDVDNLWSAAHIYVKDAPAMTEEIAKWMTQGYTDIDIDLGANVNRFYEYGHPTKWVKNRCREGFSKFYGIVHPAEQYQTSRPLRTSGFYSRQADMGAEFYELYGWETPQWFESNRDLLDTYQNEVSELVRPNDLSRPNEWDSRWWSPITLGEHLHMRDHVAMVDGSIFSIIDIAGEDALDLLQRVSVAQMDVEKGKTVYTPVLRENGGFRSDFTVARMGDDQFRVVTSGATAGADMQWFDQQLPDDSDTQIINRSDGMSALAVWGPEARNVVDSVTEEDMSNDAHPFAHARTITVGDVETWALRISYVGELGFELHVPTSKAPRLWDTIYEAGQPYDIRPVGMGVFGTTGPMEKSFQMIGTDLTQDYTPAEADRTRHGLKSEDFVGKSVYEADLETDPVAKICTLSVDDHAPNGGEERYMLGQEPVMDMDGNVLVDEKGRESYVTSAGSGPSVGKHLLKAYLPSEFAQEGTSLQVEYFGEQYPVTVESVGTTPVFDPEHSRMLK